MMSHENLTYVVWGILFGFLLAIGLTLGRGGCL